jgi:hypothetical protein
MQHLSKSSLNSPEAAAESVFKAAAESVFEAFVGFLSSVSFSFSQT